jgi:hypothetical protein
MNAKTRLEALSEALRVMGIDPDKVVRDVPALDPAVQLLISSTRILLDPESGEVDLRLARLDALQAIKSLEAAQ